MSKTKSAEATQRVSQLEGLLNKAMLEIESLRTSKFNLSRVAKPVARKNKSHFLVAMPDTHGCFVDNPACLAALEDVKRLQPSIIVLLGDHVDCGGFLAEHQTLGYVAESDYSYQDDVNAANQFLDALAAAAPNAQIVYLEGNHEIRIERWIMTQRMRNKKDAEFLRNLVGPRTVLSLDKRNIRWVARGLKHDGIGVPGVIKIGKCYFTHGSYTGTSCARKHLERFGGNVVFGHVHSAHDYQTRTVSEERIGAWSPGCLCEQQPLYMHTNPSSWVHGYHLQIVQHDESFLPVNVPIIAGRSYLDPLLSNLL